MGQLYTTSVFLLAFVFSAFGQSGIKLVTIKSTSPKVEALPQTLSATENQFALMRFSTIPNDYGKQQLKANGISLLAYIPDRAYYVKIAANSVLSQEQLTQLNIVEFLWLTPELKIHPELTDTMALPTWVYDGEKIKLVTNYYAGFINEAKREIATVTSVVVYNEQNLSATVTVNKSDILKLAQLQTIRFIEPILAPETIEEIDAMTNQRSNTLFSAGLKYDGTGVGVHIGDGGLVSNHLDYEGRLTLTNSGSESDHATHVNGIVGGAGNYDPMVQGNAPGATLFSRDGGGILSNNTVVSTAVSNGVVITNHSLGWGCNGGYNSSARYSDQQMLSFPSLIHVFSAGNSGTQDCDQYPSGWGNITGGYKQAKNVFAVANISNTDVIAGSSSRGPASDGRIKPDIAAVGSGVNHTQAGNTYGSKSGTSMAAPAVAGALATLYHAYRDLNGGQNPDASLIRALTLNTADDLGNVGPDFIYGWGRINVRKAYELMKNQQYFSGTISNNISKTHNISVPQGTERVKIMVYWADPAGLSGATKALVNDIDMTVSNGGTTVLPYTLSVSQSSSAVLNTPAFRGEDHLNNMEQIVVDNPSSSLTINLNGFTIVSQSQEYYITYEFIKDEITVTYPIGGESLSTDERYTIRWDAFGDQSTFDVEFSADNGASWSTISSGVSGSRRYFEGWSPTTNTNDGLVRVKRGTVSDVSDAVFTSVGVPTNPSFDWACNNKTRLSWDAVAGANGYTVYQMGTKFMEPIMTVASTSAILSVPDNNTDYFAVAANFNDSVGMRTIAFRKSSGTFGTCPNGPDLVVQKIISPIGKGCLKGGVTQEVVVLYGNEGTADITNFTASYNFNGAGAVSENVNSVLVPGASVEVIFNQTFTLPNSGTPNLTVLGTMSGDVNTNNNSEQLTLDLDQASYGLPLAESFDNQSNCATSTDCEATVCDLTGWLKNSSDDDIDWRVDVGGTPSANTGPSGDRSGNGKYVYLEGSECFGKVAELKSGCIELNSAANLSFYYNMNGPDMGSLSVQILDPNAGTNTQVWSLGGDQGNAWTKVTIDLSAYAGKTIQVVFVGTTGSSWETDMALDDILIETVDLTDLVITGSTTSLSTCDTLLISADGPSANNSYNWSFGANASPASATGKGPHKVYYTTTGTKTITLNGDNNLTETYNIAVTAPTEVATIQLGIMGNSPICTNDDFNFEATGANLGDAPTFDWYVNDIIQNETSANFTLVNPSNGDEVKVTATSNDVCLANNTSSDTLVIDQKEGVEHVFYISTTSMNPNGIWAITNSQGSLVESNKTYVTNGTFEQQSFCLTDDCYDFTFENAFQSGSCNEPDWVAQNYPLAGTIVSYDGNLYESQWWANPSDVPSPDAPIGSSPWLLVGDCQQLIGTDVFGVKTADNTTDYFEVTVADYVSTSNNNFCVGNGIAVTVDFNANATAVSNCDTITFTANVQGNATSYLWDFGAGASPASANGVGPFNVSYGTAGSKTVSLLVNGSEEELKSNYITVSDVMVTPSLHISTVTDPWCEGDSLEFAVTIANGGSTPEVRWYINDNLEATRTNSNFKWLDIFTGDLVYAQLTSSLLCVTQSEAESEEMEVDLINCDVTSINSQILSAIKVYPNPTNGIINISLGGEVGNANYILYSLTGAQIATGQLFNDNSAVDLTTVKPGVYFVAVATNYGIKTIEIIKK